ncbi:hypothetical protein ACQKD0_05130 [Vreelandella aquamarina]|uniref:hypothetical protein n=1 Tax=Vreelandella aquamarina TaxID=77097 RepID=UPI003D07F03E
MRRTIDLSKQPSRWVSFKGAEFLICLPSQEVTQEAIEWQKGHMQMAYRAAGGDEGFLSRNVLIDWRNVKDKSGNTIPYTPMDAMNALHKQDLKDFILEAVQQLADDCSSGKGEE